MKITFIYIFSFSFLISCTNSDPLIIDGPAGKAEYYIFNQSDIDLNIVFVSSIELNSVIDTTKSVSSNFSEKIFEDGGIGFNPKPSNSFKKISFYDSSSTNNQPLLIINDIINEDWDILEQDLGDSGYGLTKYQLSITNNDFVN